MAFEITSTWISFFALFRILRSVPGVEDVKRQYFNEDRASFKYRGVTCVVNEPFGDNSRYWVGPAEPRANPIDMQPINSAFEHYTNPIARAWAACTRKRGDA